MSNETSTAVLGPCEMEYTFNLLNTQSTTQKLTSWQPLLPTTDLTTTFSHWVSGIQPSNNHPQPMRAHLKLLWTNEKSTYNHFQPNQTSRHIAFKLLPLSQSEARSFAGNNKSIGISKEPLGSKHFYQLFSQWNMANCLVIYLSWVWGSIYHTYKDLPDRDRTG